MLDLSWIVDSISDSRFMIFDVLIQHWSFNIILFAKMSQLSWMYIFRVNVDRCCCCCCCFFFFDIVSHLFWWLLEVMGNRQNIVFFLLFGWKWQCVYPFRWVFQDKVQSCYFPSIPHLHQSKLWNINNVLELLYVNFLFQSDSSERLWKITGIVFGFLNFRLQHLWTFPRNGSGLWLLDFHRLHQRILSHKWHVLAFSKFVVSSPVVTILMDMVDISYTFPKMNDKLFCKILTFIPFVSHDWLHIKLLFRSLACKEEAMSWRPVFLIFICKTLFWFFFLKFQSPLWKIRNQHNRQIELASCGSCFLISRFHHQA